VETDPPTRWRVIAHDHSGDTDMAIGGSKRRFEQESPGERSRTALVIDQLLSRGPMVGQASPGPDARSATRPWTSVGEVLRSSTPTILEGHLTWLAARTQRIDPLSPQRILLEDQIRILVRSLDERDEDDAITRALEQPWVADGVPDDGDGIITYATALRRASEGQPDDSPYVALARSAAMVAAEILGHRDSATTRRHFV
jgi:hypothetical protein